MANLSTFCSACVQSAKAYVADQTGMMVHILDIFIKWRGNFDDEEWYGREAQSLSGERNQDIVALIKREGGVVSPKVVSKVHKLFNATVGGQDTVKIDMDKARALSKKIKDGKIKISHLINIPTKPKGQRSAPVTQAEKALDYCNKTSKDKLKDNEYIKQICVQYGHLYGMKKK
jgi:hypothetical protein